MRTRYCGSPHRKCDANAKGADDEWLVRNNGLFQAFSLAEGGSRMLGALLVVAFVIAIGPLAVLYGRDSRLDRDRGSFF